MTKILTATQIKSIATVNNNFDPAFFDKSIEYWQTTILKKLLTADLYDDFIANVGALPAIYQTLLDDYIQFALSYGVAFLAIKKDNFSQLNNRGVTANRGDYSNPTTSVAMQLKEYKEREYSYLYDLGCYLIENRATYPLFDYENTYLGTDFRDFTIV